MRKISCPCPVFPCRFRHGGASIDPGSVLDFSASVNPLGPPPTVMAALRGALAGSGREGSLIASYPDPDCTALRNRLAGRHGVMPAQVVIGNGSGELIQAIPLACPPRRVAVAEPVYTEYLRASSLAGAEVAHWLAEGAAFDLEPFDPEGADLVWLCNPNNPTGRLWPRGVLRPWVEAHPRTLFVLDESFLAFRPDETEHSLIAHVARLPNLVVIRSLTKVYTLAGLRLGYAVSAPELAECLRARLVPWSVNALAQLAGLTALEDRTFLGETHAWFRSETRYMADALRGLARAFDLVPSKANFMLLRLRGTSSAWLSETLRARGFLVRDASNFVGLDGRYVRIGLRTPEQNRLLLGQLQECLMTETHLKKGRGESLR
jgi:threonine-phosphate decarboxylase